MQIRHLAALLVLSAACEHADEIIEVEVPAMPASTLETQRLNVDEIGPKVVRHAGVAPVRVTPLADPKFVAPREQVSAFEDPPPPEPVVVTESQVWYGTLDAAGKKLVGQICREAKNDPCFGLLRTVGGTPTRMQQLMAQLGSEAHATGHTVRNYCHEQDPRIVCDTPLVVAFDNEAIELVPGSTQFAFQPGVPVTTDWPTSSTPWIALDRDGDGAITSGAELFGDATALPDGAKAVNGFSALAALDDNRDGVIDRRDPAFAKLVLWSDRDGDRRSSPSELRALSEVMVSIPLAYDVVPRCVDGNCEGERAAATWRDASGALRTGAVVDVYLRRRF